MKKAIPFFIDIDKENIPGSWISDFEHIPVPGAVLLIKNTYHEVGFLITNTYRGAVLLI